MHLVFFSHASLQLGKTPVHGVHTLKYSDFNEELAKMFNRCKMTNPTAQIFLENVRYWWS